MKVSLDIEALQLEIANLKRELSDREVLLRYAKAAGLDRSAGDAALAVLKRDGIPKSTIEIMGELRRFGYGQQFKQFYNTVFVALSRHPQIEKLSNGLWDVRQSDGSS